MATVTERVVSAIARPFTPGPASPPSHPSAHEPRVNVTEVMDGWLLGGVHLTVDIVTSPNRLPDGDVYAEEQMQFLSKAIETAVKDCPEARSVERLAQQLEKMKAEMADTELNLRGLTEQLDRLFSEGGDYAPAYRAVGQAREILEAQQDQMDRVGRLYRESLQSLAARKQELWRRMHEYRLREASTQRLAATAPIAEEVKRITREYLKAVCLERRLMERLGRRG